ncbi:MAG TPA: hypothetical protein VN655_03060 [Pseudolabrys sp.]|jgi:hypothetical protein|nr:hypothetical protein [Pseudolabrys sp.]
MTRLKDYLCFAVHFAGLGYIVLWPVSTPGNGDLFGAPFLCGGAAALDLICRMPHPLRLGIGLHVFGALCAVLAVLHLLARAAARMRRRGAQPAAAEIAPPPAPTFVAAASRPRARLRRMPPPRKLERPRSHFGLRGVPQ